MVNDQMPEYVTGRVGRILNRFQKALNGAKVLVLGVAYKQDVADYRESPALRVIECLEQELADVSFFDPYIQEYKYKGKIHRGLLELRAETLRASDIVLITAMHSNVDYQFVAGNAPFIFDAKNAMKAVRERGNIEVL